MLKIQIVLFVCWLFGIRTTRSSSQGCSIKKLFLKLPKCLQHYIKETPTQMFSCDYWEIFKNTYFEIRLLLNDGNIKNPYKHTTCIPRWNNVERTCYFHVVLWLNTRGVFIGICLGTHLNQWRKWRKWRKWNSDMRLYKEHYSCKYHYFKM